MELQRNKAMKCKLVESAQVSSSNIMKTNRFRLGVGRKSSTEAEACGYRDPAGINFIIDVRCSSKYGAGLSFIPQ